MVGKHTGVDTVSKLVCVIQTRQETSECVETIQKCLFATYHKNGNTLSTTQLLTDINSIHIIEESVILYFRNMSIDHLNPVLQIRTELLWWKETTSTGHVHGAHWCHWALEYLSDYRWFISNLFNFILFSVTFGDPTGDWQKYRYNSWMRLKQHESE